MNHSFSDEETLFCGQTLVSENDAGERRNEEMIGGRAEVEG